MAIYSVFFSILDHSALAHDTMVQTYAQAPDGGWGWLVVGGNLLMQVPSVRIREKTITNSDDPRLAR